MSNYLYNLIAKSFNLIDTVQPLVLSVFEPLPESTLDWQPSINTESAELETTSETDRFPDFGIVQSLEGRSPPTNLQISEEITNPFLTNLTSTPVEYSQQILKLTPNFVQKPDLKLFSNWSFSEPVLSQSNTDNQKLTLNPEQKTSITLLTFTPAQLSQKQLNQINTAVSFVQNFNINNQELTSNTEGKSSTIPLIYALTKLPQKQPFLNNQSIETNRLFSLHPLPKVFYFKQSFPLISAETSTILSIPSVLQQEKSATENLHQQPTEINSVFTHSQLTQVKNSEAFLSQLQSQAKAISSLPFENYFVEQDTTHSLLPQKSGTVNSANAPVITQLSPLTPVLAVENNTSASIAFQPQEQLESELAQKPNLQIANISTSEILSNQIIEQLTAISSLPDAKHLLPQSGKSSSANTPVNTQVLPLIPALAVDTNTPTSTVIQTQEQLESELAQKPNLQTGNISTSEILLSQIIEQPKAMPMTGFAYAPATTQVLPLASLLGVETNTPISTVIQPQEKLESELAQKPNLQTGNISTLEILSSQIIEQPKAMPTTGFAYAPATTQVLPLASLLGVETNTFISTVIQTQEKLESELAQEPNLQTGNISTLEILSSQIIEQPKAMPTTGFAYTPITTKLSSLTPVLAVKTSRPTSIVIQRQVKDEEISSVNSANTFIIDTTLTNSHKQRFTPTIAIQKSTEPQEKLTSNVPEIQPRVVYKKISSMHPILTDVSAKLSSPQTNSSTPPFVNKLLLSVAPQPTTGLSAINSHITPTPALHPSTAGTDIQSQVNFSDSYLSDFHREKASAQEVSSQNYNTNYRKHSNIQKISVVEKWDELRQAETETNVSHAHHSANMQPQEINRNEYILDFLHKSGKGEGGRGKSSVLSPSPLTFTLFPPLAKSTFARGLLNSPVENLILLQNAFPNLSMSADRGKDWAVYSFFRELEESDLRPLSEPIYGLTVKNLSLIAASSKQTQKRSSAEYETSPTIQVKIGRLEIRSAAPPAAPPPRSKPRPASAVMSLNEYLQRRARRG